MNTNSPFQKDVVITEIEASDGDVDVNNVIAYSVESITNNGKCQICPCS